MNRNLSNPAADVLSAICDALGPTGHQVIDSEAVLTLARSRGVSDDQFSQGIGALQRKGMIDVPDHAADSVYSITIRPNICNQGR